MSQKVFVTISLVLMWVGLATYADTQFKNYPRFNSWHFVFGLLLYAVCAFFAVAVFKRGQFGWVIIMWNSESLILSMILSVTMFNEVMTMRRLISSILVLIAIVLGD